MIEKQLPNRCRAACKTQSFCIQSYAQSDKGKKNMKTTKKDCENRFIRKYNFDF